MDRRSFLTALALGAAASLTGCVEAKPPSSARAAAVPNLADAVHGAGGASANEAAPLLEPSPSSSAQLIADPAVPAQPSAHGSVIDRLSAPAGGGVERRVALTIDDGLSTEVLSAYVQFLTDANLRATFFVTAVYNSWTVVKKSLSPLVASGQVQLANHTWDHPSITTLSASQITSQLNRTERFLWNTYGVRGAPYFRPPYGHHNQRTDHITAEQGFSRTVMWLGSLGDAAPLTGDQILTQARQWLLPGHVVIGHANHPGVTTIYPQLLDLLRERALQTVTLHDAFDTLTTLH